MNHRQLVLVRSSYERIRMVRSLFADLFHRRLFLVAPRLELILQADPARRDAAFLEIVDMVVQRLDRLDLLLPTLAAHARRWSRRGVVDGDYALAGKALAWTVEQLMREPAAIASWRDTFEFLSGVMRRAVSDAQAIPPCPRRAAPSTRSPTASRRRRAGAGRCPRRAGARTSALITMRPRRPKPRAGPAGPHHTAQTLAGRIGVPSLQPNAAANSGTSATTPFTR